MGEVLAVIGILAGTGTAAVIYRLTGPRVRVEIFIASLISETETRAGLCIRAVNIGRAPVVIAGWGVIEVDGRFTASPRSEYWSNGVRVPFALTQEKPAATWSLDYHEQKAALAEQHPGVPLVVHGFVRLQTTRKVVKSKTVVGLDGHVKSQTIRDRWDEARRSGLGVWFTQAGPPGGPHYLPIFNNKGPRAARRVEVDLVPKPGTGQTGAQPAFVARRRIVRKNKYWMLPIPDSAYEGEKEFRIRYRTLGKNREFRHGVPDRARLEAGAQLAANGS